MADVGILGSPFFTNVVLPFLLIFVLVYAILDKSKILGEKKDINAIVSLVFALTTVALPSAFGAVDVIIKIIPIVSVIIVIILAFMLTYGFVGGTKEGVLNDPWHVFFAIVVGLALLASVAWSTGLLGYVTQQAWASQALQTFLIIASVVAVIAIVTSSGGTGGKKPAAP
jgi:hypothetical protein